jgi:ribosome-associated protein
MLSVTNQIQIPLTELDFQYVRSSGPGGQNVNKVATKAVLRWDVTTSPSLSEEVRMRFLERYGGRVNTEGVLVISSDRHRSQSRNADDCLDRLRELLLEVAEPPKPRRPTRPSAGVRRRRLADKRRVAVKKQTRRIVHDDE